MGALVQRLYGSDDLFPDDAFHAYHPYQSVNFLNAHDGFTLYDTVAYNVKRNQANGENNRDGHEPNHSWNCGHEGDDGVPAGVMQLRQRQAKNFFTLLLLANGTPMFGAGAEFLHTQRGNNNAYNQDNETSWIDWNRLSTFGDYARFVRKLIQFRKGETGLSRSRFWRADVLWYGPNGPTDYGLPSRSMAFSLKLSDRRTLYAMVNAYWEGQQFTFGEAGPWSRIVNTFLAGGTDYVDEETEWVDDTYFVGSRSVAVVVKTEDAA